ncbi:MAG: hypothetical protein AAGE01_05235 [Pseudomonadota bacterium]
MIRTVIMGAAGRDFHVFNCCYRGRDDGRVVAFTAAQIPHIDDRRYPAALAGDAYPDGIPIVPESELTELLLRESVDEVVFAYSDVSVQHVEACRERVESAGVQRFRTFDVDATMLASSKPVIAVTTLRTGCGKSQTTRWVARRLREQGHRVVAIRHPMPYGDLAAQAVQRFATLADLESTINAVDCDQVMVATPIDLARVININHPAMRVAYELDEPSGHLAAAVLAGVQEAAA